MVCSGCGAHLIDGTQKCPFCKELIVGGRTLNSDVTYKIDSPKQFELIKNSTKSGISPDKKREKNRRKRRQKIKAYLILAAMAAVLIAIIIGIISLFISIFSDDTEYTTAFYSDNILSLYYDGEVITLTEEAVNLKTLDDNSVSAVSDVISAAGLVKTSKDGQTTCFIDKFDSKNNYGTLKVIIGNDRDEIITISDKVNSLVLISDDGEHILFLKNANAKGNQGELWYSNHGSAAVKIADKVDADKFVFSEDFEKVIYIKEYNYKARCGTAYSADFDDFNEIKIDKDVYAVYGSSEDGDSAIYSKSYNDNNKTFDLYMKNSDEAVRLVMGCKASPVMSENGEYLFACGDENNDRFSLYRIDADNMTAEKIISNMSNIIRVSEDGEKVLYSKLFENNVGDYYIWTEGETELKVADGVNYTKENQLAVSADFEKVAYISNYDENKNGGVLYQCEYSEDSVTNAEKISEDVFDCYVLKNKNIVYNKNYNNKGKTAELYMYNGVENEINSEINPRYLSTYGDDIICLYDYSSKAGGNLYVIDEDLSEAKITTDVYDFRVKKNGALSVMRNKDSKTGRFDLYETDDDKENISLIKKDVNGILKY